MNNTERLVRLQTELSRSLVLEDRFSKPISRIAGVDMAFIGDKAIAACIVLDYENLDLVEEAVAQVDLNFPYKPGFLWFREGPAILQAVKRVHSKPDVFMVNAHGIAHPKRFGCASHLGVVLGKPTIGVAGTRLCGQYERLPARPGESEPLRMDNKIVGFIIKPKKGKPIYISPGHMLNVKSAARITIHCLRDHRLPEPLHLAHTLANSVKRGLRQQCA
jgi:deoxyribonuclease V